MNGLDPAVLERQAFGAMLSRTARDRELADRVMSGELELTPHPVWQLPAELTWAEDPFGQRNWMAQLHMLRWLDPVRRVALTGDETARQYWLRTARSWVEANPVGAGQSAQAWADMVDSIRALALAFGTRIADEHDLEWLLPSVVQHGEWLSDPANLGHSNHALHQHQGLFVLGRALGRDDWAELAVQRINVLIEDSYDEQGINDEGAIAYHRNNLIWWTTALKRLDAEGIERPPAAIRLERSALALAHATRPDGLLEMIGDTSATRPTGIPSPHLRYVLTEGSDGTPPEDLSAVYDRGYVFGRSGWGEYERDFGAETFYSASFGPANRVHGHMDGGSLTFFANGRPWVVDSGKYGYITGARMRGFALSRASHSVVTIVGKPYDRTTTVELKAHALKDDLDDLTFVDRGYDGVELTRRVVYCRGGDFLLVVDAVRSDEEVVAEQLWHLAPEVSSQRSGNGFDLSADDVSARIAWTGIKPELSVVRGSEEPFQGWVSTHWAQKEPADVLVARRQGERFRFVTFVASPKHGAFTVDSVTTLTGGLMASVTSGSEQFHIVIGAGPARISMGERPDSAPAVAAAVSSAPLERLRRSLPTDDVIDPGLATDPRSAVVRVSRAVEAAAGSRRARHAGARVLVDRLASMTPAAGELDADHGIRAAVVDLLAGDLDQEVGPVGDLLGVQRQPVLAWDEPLLHPRYQRPIERAEQILSRLPSLQGAVIGALPRDGLVMPFVVRDGVSDALLVRFHGAINRTRTELPVFQGLTSDTARPYAFLNLQDPTLDLDRSMNLSWFLGTTEVDVHAVAADLVRAVATGLGKRRVVLLGSSGGGYAALQVGTRLPGSVVVAFNPQIVLRSYHRRAVAKAMAASFAMRPDAVGSEQVEQRLSFVHRLQASGTRAHNVVVQNMGDAHHLREHQGPLRRLVSAGDLADRFDFHEVDLGKGHVSAPPAMYGEYIEQALALGSALESGLDITR